MAHNPIHIKQKIESTLIKMDEIQKQKDFQAQSLGEILTTKVVKPDVVGPGLRKSAVYRQIFNLEEAARDIMSRTDNTDQEFLKDIEPKVEALKEILSMKCGKTYEEIQALAQDIREGILQEEEAPTANYVDDVEGLTAKRFRISFKGNQEKVGKETLAEETRRVCKEIIVEAKNYDKDVAITTWEDPGVEFNLQTIKDLSNEVLCKVLQCKMEGPLKGDCRGIGIRIVTKLTAEEFTRQWSVAKWRNKGQNITLREAESQVSEQATAIGYMHGTTPSGDYKTLKREIYKETEGSCEISWQVTNIPNVSGKIWEIANKEALKDGSRFEPAHKRKKWAWAPEALVVYVNNKDKVKEAKKCMTEKYGNKVETTDGSSVRFVPFIFGKKDQETRKKLDQKLYHNMQMHCALKATEVEFKLDIKDIHETKDYLGGQSIEQILHRMKDADGNRIFKHIARTFSKNFNDEKYSVVCSFNMVTQARKAVDELKTNLHDMCEPGEQIFQHFTNAQRGLLDSESAKRNREEEEFDDEDAKTYFDQEPKDFQKEKEELPMDILYVFGEGDNMSEDSDVITIESGKTRIPSILRNSPNKRSDESVYSQMSEITTGSARSGVSGVSWADGPDVLKTKIKQRLGAEHFIESERFENWYQQNETAFEVLTTSHNSTKTRANAISNHLRRWERKAGAAAAGASGQNT